VAAPSNTWVCGRSFAGIAGANPDGAWMSVIVGCCQVHVSASGWSLVQTSAAECGVYNECDREAPCREAMNRNWVQALQKEMNDLSDKYVGISG